MNRCCPSRDTRCLDGLIQDSSCAHRFGDFIELLCMKIITCVCVYIYIIDIVRTVEVGVSTCCIL